MKIEMGKTNLVHSKDPTHSINNANGRMTDNKFLIPDVPFHPSPVYRPPPNPIRPVVSNQQSSPTQDSNPNINLDQGKFFISGGCIVQNFSKTQQIIFSKA